MANNTFVSKDKLLYFKQKIVTLLSGKQDVINDLSDIRSGASAGASAVQPGDNVSDLVNDSGFITDTVNNLTNYYKKTETYTQSEINNLIASAKTGRFVVANSLPSASADTMNAIYLIPTASSATGNVKDEYITIQDGSTYKWELIGSTAVDLSVTWQKSELTEITNSDIDSMFS